jgi:hypothetical protein
MSITLDDRAAMSYEEMAIACSKDIEDYKTLLKSIEAMIAQKQRNLQSIKDKTVGLVKTSLGITQEIPANQPSENFDDTGVDMVSRSCERRLSGDNSTQKRANAKVQNR